MLIDVLVSRCTFVISVVLILLVISDISNEVTLKRKTFGVFGVLWKQ